MEDKIAKLIAWVIVVAFVVLIPIGILIASVMINWLILLSIPAYFLIINAGFNWIKRFADDDPSGPSGSDKLGAKEKIVTVLNNEKGKKIV